MQRDWKNVGSKYNRTPRQRKVLDGIFAKLTWFAPKAGEQLPMMPAMGVEAVIQEFRIPKVSRIAIDGVHLGRYGVYGIEGNYKNGRAMLYVLDTGSGINPLAVDFYPVEEAESTTVAAPAEASA